MLWPSGCAQGPGICSSRSGVGGTTAGLQDKVEKLLRKMGKYNKNRRYNKNIWD